MAEYVLGRHLEGEGKRLALMSPFMLVRLATDQRHLPPLGVRFRVDKRSGHKRARCLCRLLSIL